MVKTLPFSLFSLTLQLKEGWGCKCPVVRADRGLQTCDSGSVNQAGVVTSILMLMLELGSLLVSQCTYKEQGLCEIMANQLQATNLYLVARKTI